MNLFGLKVSGGIFTRVINHPFTYAPLLLIRVAQEMEHYEEKQW